MTTTVTGRNGFQYDAKHIKGNLYIVGKFVAIVRDGVCHETVCRATKANVAAIMDDLTFENAMFEWFYKRSRELYAEPNHPEFQSRIDEHQKVFAAMLAIKMSMLPDDRKSQVAESLIRSFCD